MSERTMNDKKSAKVNTNKFVSKSFWCTIVCHKESFEFTRLFKQSSKFTKSPLFTMCFFYDFSFFVVLCFMKGMMQCKRSPFVDWISIRITSLEWICNTLLIKSIEAILNHPPNCSSSVHKYHSFTTHRLKIAVVWTGVSICICSCVCICWDVSWMLLHTCLTRGSLVWTGGSTQGQAGVYFPVRTLLYYPSDCSFLY